MSSLGRYLQRLLDLSWSRALQGVQPPTLDSSRNRIQQHNLSPASSYSVSGNNRYSQPLVSKGEETSEAVSRARTYFLVSAVVSHALTFGIGPSELKGDNEDGPEDSKKQKNGEESDAQRDGAPHQRYRDDPEAQEDDNEDDDDDSSDSAPETSLLPRTVRRGLHKTNKHTHSIVNQSMEKLPSFLQVAITAVYNFMTPPLVGAIIGAVIGLAPPSTGFSSQIATRAATSTPGSLRASRTSVSFLSRCKSWLSASSSHKR